jgi:beta-lactamase regulating signal transducer with metallopeptidase domain
MNHLLPAIAWTLIHFCWQAAAIAALYGAVSLLLARRSSHTRYAVALAALLLMLTSATVTFGWQLRANGAFAQDSVSAPAGSPARFQRTVAYPFAQVASTLASEASSPSAPTPLPWIDGFWLVGVFLLSLRSLGGWWLIRRLRASAHIAIPAAVGESFQRIAAALGIRRSVDLAVTASVSGPITVGFLRATVLLPLCALTSLGPDELEVVLAHELAHVRRADFLWNLVQTFAETLFFFHPAVWWIGSCLRSERELCCDDLALEFCPNPVIYASALFHLEEQRSRQPHLAMALNGNRSRSTLRMRILRILGEPVTHTVHTPSRAFSISVAIAGLLILVFPSSQVLASLHPLHAAATTHAKVQVLPTALLQSPQSAPAPTPAIAPSSDAAQSVDATPAVAPPAPDPNPDSQEPAPAPEKPQAGARASSDARSSEGKSTYIDRMKAAGYDVDLDKYIALKIQNVTPEYATAMSKVGFGKLSADDLIACKIQGVSPDAIAEMKKEGLEVSSVHDAVSFRIFQVTPEFIAGMKAAGFTNVSSQDLIGMRVQGVTPEYARAIAQQFPGATVEDLIKTRIFNIDPAFIASAKAHGFNNLKLDKLVQLRISGLLDDEK